MKRITERTGVSKRALMLTQSEALLLESALTMSIHYQSGEEDSPEEEKSMRQRVREILLDFAEEAR